MDDRLLWVDVETDGLYPWKGNRLFEIGFKLTNLNLTVLQEASWTLYYPGMEDETFDPFIQEMHTKNGLFADMHNRGIRLQDAETDIVSRLEDWEVSFDRTVPTCGNSLRLDREFISCHMPKVDNILSYRIIDVSSFKETIKRYHPDLYAAYQELYPDDEKGHRVMADIDHSIAEYRFYLQGLGIL